MLFTQLIAPLATLMAATTQAMPLKEPVMYPGNAYILFAGGNTCGFPYMAWAYMVEEKGCFNSPYPGSMGAVRMASNTFSRPRKLIHCALVFKYDQR